MLENLAFWDVMLGHRASSSDVFEESPSYSLRCNTLEEGWRDLLRAHAQIVYKFRRNSCMCIFEF
jgi:hypothetical protein